MPPEVFAVIVHAADDAADAASHHEAQGEARGETIAVGLCRRSKTRTAG